MTTRGCGDAFNRARELTSDFAAGAACAVGAAFSPPPSLGREKEGAEMEALGADGDARFLVFVGLTPYVTILPSWASLATRSDWRERARALALAFLAASSPASATMAISWAAGAGNAYSMAATAGCAIMVRDTAPAMAALFAPSEAMEALTVILRAAFLGAVTRAATTGVATRDIIFSFVKEGEGKVLK